MIKQHLVVIAIFAVTRALPLTSEVSLQLEVSQSLTTGFSLGLKLFSASDPSSTIIQKIDFKTAETLIGNSKILKWGFDCDKDINCSITNDSYQKEIYDAAHYTYLEAEADFQLTKVNKKATKNEDAFDFRYIQSIDDFYELNWGIIGLSPNSTFFAYLYKNIGAFNIACDFKPDEKSNGEWDMKMYLNHHTEVVKAETSLTKTDQWQFAGRFDSLSQDPALICLEPLSGYLVNFPQSAHFCLENLGKACKGKSTCGADDIDYNLASHLRYTIGDASFDFSPSEYIYFKNGNAACRFCNAQLDNGCDMTLGRYAMKKYPPVLIIGEEAKLQFVEYLSYEQDTSLLGWVLGGAVLALIALFAALEMIVKKITKENEGGLKEKLVEEKIVVENN